MIPPSFPQRNKQKKCPQGRKTQSGGGRQQGGGGGGGGGEGGGLEVGLHCVQGAVGSNPTEWKEIRGLPAQQ